jgi:hypothetical protein
VPATRCNAPRTRPLYARRCKRFWRASGLGAQSVRSTTCGRAVIEIISCGARAHPWRPARWTSPPASHRRTPDA